MRALILTIDLGTSRCKSTLFDAHGHEFFQATADYPSFFPRPGWAEQNPADWWRAVVDTVRRLLNRNPGLSTDVQAISVTGQMHGLLCIDSVGMVLGPCMTLHDRRSLTETAHLREILGEKAIYEITGGRLDPTLPAPKALWIRRHLPEIFERARCFLGCKDFIRFRLTGNLKTDPIDAAATLLFDLERREWSVPMLEACQLSAELLPPIQPAEAIDGALLSSPAQEMGLRPGIPVVVGAGDDIEFVGAGLVEPGTVLEHLGTTGSLLLCSNHVVKGWNTGLEKYPHLVPGLWVLGGSTSAAGVALKWAAETFANVRQLSLADLPEEAESESSLVFLPYLASQRCPVWSPDARGVFYGLGLHHSRFDLMRAVFEGVAFSLRHVLDALTGLDTRPTMIRIAERAREDRAWTQLRANIYGVPLAILEQKDPTAYGAMLVAAVAIGLYSSLSEAADKTVSLCEVVRPNDERISHYELLYQVYRKASKACLSVASSATGSKENR